jgi:PKD domain
MRLCDLLVKAFAPAARADIRGCISSLSTCIAVSATRPRGRRGQISLACAVVVSATLACRAVDARAVILPAVTIDGPSENIAGFGNVAMAEDGTGGLVYLKRVGGIPHVFVARYVGGHWLAPIRVDNEQPFAASWPRIGAAEGGQLVVVWATPFATEHELPVDELLGSTLGPGSAAFGPAQLIDPDIRDGTGTTPDLAVSSTGKADVVYRVIGNSASQRQVIPLLRAGDVIGEVRAAHYNGETWSRLGAVNRNLGVSMRPPTKANAPHIAIGPTGNGVVVWQEPDVDGVARIWARRLFGSALDYVMPVSAQELGGRRIAQDADASSVAISRLGQAEVAYRQSYGAGSPLAGPRILLNTLPDGESASGAQFEGAKLIDTAVSGGAAGVVGPPNIDIDDKRDLRVLYDANGTPRVIQGNDLGLTGALPLDRPPFAGAEAFAASVMNPAGGGVSAWPSADSQGHEAVAVREDFPSGAMQTALLSGGAGGPVGELAVARSGLGDGLVSFLQGPLGNAAVVSIQVSAPPAQFVLSVPNGPVKPSQATISWQPAPSAVGPLSYGVVLDGRLLPTPSGAFEVRLDARRLADGTHRVQVLATDRDGQATLTPAAALIIDARPPSVKVKRAFGGRGVSVRVSDPDSGVDAHRVSVTFGDGASARGHTRFTHRYARGGVYLVAVRVGDKLGNRGVVRQLVSVR